LPARVVALGLALGAFGSLAAAPASFAAAPAPPAIGSNCQADGKISGAGSTFQANAINNSFTYGFQQDVCGPQPNVANLTAAWGTTDPSVFSFTDAAGTHSVPGMVAYNYSLNSTPTSNGSGAGLNHLSCRTDFFSGTDLPYNASQFTSLKGAAGALPVANGTTCAAAINTGAVPAPYGPQPTATPPATGDTASTPLNFPTAGGAVAYAINLNSMCTSGPPTSINLTADEFNKIWEGTINQWNDSELTTTNPILTTDGCTGNIQRVVRFDNSGTTAITMFTLNGIDPQPGTLCGTDNATTWLGIATSSNNSGKWPQANGASPDCVDSTSHAAPNPVTGGANGSPTLITKLLATNGGIGYAELGLWPNPLPAGVTFVNLQTASDFNTPGNGLTNPNPGNDTNGNPPYSGPGSPGSASLCKFQANFPLGSGPLQGAGLSPATAWENDPTGPLQPEKIAFNGSGYPACGLTFDLVQSKIHNGETGEVASPTAGTFTPGCQIPAESTTLTGAQTLPEATVTVASTAGFPTAGTLNVGGQTVTYTGVTTTTFTGAAGGTGTIADGSSVTLVSTTAPSTSARPGVNGACQTVAGTTSPVVGATDDQLRTLYSYFTYALSPLGQSYLAGQTLDQLPAQWLTFEQQGFQQNF
jgi:ABC-type phosphate transport system substrate-binding protein